MHDIKAPYFTVLAGLRKHPCIESILRISQLQFTGASSWVSKILLAQLRIVAPHEHFHVGTRDKCLPVYISVVIYAIPSRLARCDLFLGKRKLVGIAEC